MFKRSISEIFISEFYWFTREAQVLAAAQKRMSEQAYPRRILRLSAFGNNADTITAEAPTSWRCGIPPYY